MNFSSMSVRRCSSACVPNSLLFTIYTFIHLEIFEVHFDCAGSQNLRACTPVVAPCSLSGLVIIFRGRQAQGKPYALVVSMEPLKLHMQVLHLAELSEQTTDQLLHHAVLPQRVSLVGCFLAATCYLFFFR